MSSCRKETETTLHYLLHSDFYSIYRIELLNDICALTNFLKNIVEENLLKVLLYGAEECSSKINSEILKCTIKFIKKKKTKKKPDHFSGPLFLSSFSPSDSDQVLNIFLCILCSI